MLYLIPFLLLFISPSTYSKERQAFTYGRSFYISGSKANIEWLSNYRTHIRVLYDKRYIVDFCTAVKEYAPSLYSSPLYMPYGWPNIEDWQTTDYHHSMSKTPFKQNEASIVLGPFLNVDTSDYCMSSFVLHFKISSESWSIKGVELKEYHNETKSAKVSFQQNIENPVPMDKEVKIYNIRLPSDSAERGMTNERFRRDWMVVTLTDTWEPETYADTTTAVVKTDRTKYTGDIINFRLYQNLKYLIKSLRLKAYELIKDKTSLFTKKIFNKVPYMFIVTAFLFCFLQYCSISAVMFTLLSLKRERQNMGSRW